MKYKEKDLTPGSIFATRVVEKKRYIVVLIMKISHGQYDNIVHYSSRHGLNEGTRGMCSTLEMKTILPLLSNYYNKIV